MALAEPPDDILRRAREGDERAFAVIVRAYETAVFNYVLRLVRDRGVAEDLCQEIFLRVFQGLPKFSLRSRFTTWLFQVAKNRAIDEIRAAERRPARLNATDDFSPVGAADAPVERLELLDAIWRAVEALDVDLKLALLLRDVTGLSYSDIAETLQITLSTVKWRIYEARRLV